jgi:hypothetical protein
MRNTGDRATGKGRTGAPPGRPGPPPTGGPVHCLRSARGRPACGRGESGVPGSPPCRSAGGYGLDPFPVSLPLAVRPCAGLPQTYAQAVRRAQQQRPQQQRRQQQREDANQDPRHGRPPATPLRSAVVTGASRAASFG